MAKEETQKEEKEGKEEELQQRYLELQMLGKTIKQGQQKIEQLDQQLESMLGLMNSLEELKQAKTGTEMLSPIGEGMFVKSELKENDELIVNVGSSVAVTKTVDEAKELLRKKIDEGQRFREQMMEELSEMAGHAKKAEEEFAAMME